MGWVGIDGTASRIFALKRFVELVDWCLAPGGTLLLGFTERHAGDLERVLAALDVGAFTHEQLSAKQCLSREDYALPANAACHSSIALRCARVGEVVALRSAVAVQT